MITNLEYFCIEYVGGGNTNFVNLCPYLSSIDLLNKFLYLY